VSDQRPIFNSGLYGKANRVVMNGLVDAAEAFQQHRDGIEWATLASAPDRFSTRYFLGRVTSATAISGTHNRWTYSGVPIVTLADHSVASINDSSDQFSNAINLRECFNEAQLVDSMNTVTPGPGFTVGPVGSVWTGSTWSTSDLKAVMLIGVTLNTNGSPRYFFDRPNPSRCT
jgi:hypothetical protein